MKTKPHRHKELNTFRFKTFSERVAAIDVDVFHRVCHRYEVESEEKETYLQQSIEKWNLLNLSESYAALRKEMPMVHTLPQILNKKDEVVAVLVKHIHLDNALAIQPTLELVVALARDLRQEFYPYYYEILQRLVELLETKDPKQLEWTFTCLAYLFKFLWRCLVKDVRIVFDSLLPLLAHKKPYINNFAAESFAFVARRVKDKKAFLALVLHTLAKRSRLAEKSSIPLKSWLGGEVGCGVLLFEVIRGVKGKFHSCAQEVLPMYFKALADESFPQDLLFDVLTHMLTSLCKLIYRANSAPLWTSLLDALTSFTSSWQNDPTERNTKNVELVLQLLNQAVTFRESQLLTEPVTVIKQITDILKLTDFPEAVMFVASEIGSTILMLPNANLPQDVANNIMVKLLAVPYVATLMGFVENVFDYAGFESLVLPQVLRHSSGMATKKIPDEVLCLLTKLVIHKAQPCDTGIDLDRWHRYPLKCPNANIPKAILKTLSVSSIRSLVDNIEVVVCSLIILPHLSPLDHSTAASKLKKIIYSLCQDMKETEKSKETSEESDAEAIEVTSKVNFLLVLAIEALVHITDPKSLLALCDFDVIVDSLLPGSTQLGCLRALDIFVSAANVSDFEQEAASAALAKIYDHLVPNLSSPFHKVRLLTVHLFSLFEPAGQGVATKSMFSLCLAAEQVPNTITEYRDKLHHLQNLEFGSSKLTLPDAARYDKAPLYYILGVLYVNFNLLWEPVTKILVTHALGMHRNAFWDVFCSHLRLAAENVVSNKKDIDPKISFADGCDFLQQLHETSMCNSEDRTDFVNYRILLWKAMLQFPEVYARKTKDLTPIFLTFLEQEYHKADASEAPSWNIKLFEKGDADQTMDQSEMMNDSELLEMEVDQSVVEAEMDTAVELDADGDLDPEEETGFDESTTSTQEADPEAELAAIRKKLSQRPPKAEHKLGVGVNRSLTAHLSIFPKIKEPGSVFREDELRKVYHDLLLSKSTDVQKLALDCLMAYKYPFMVPYREHLYGLIENKSLKSTLTLFRVDKESELLHESHREDLMPVVLRILYSKMMTKAPHKGGKGIDASQLRKAIVLRFLAGCHEDELMIFVKMAFRIYDKFLAEDALLMVEMIMAGIDLEKVVPPRRLNSSMQLLAVMLYQFGGLMGDRLRNYLLRVLLAVAANVVGMFKQRDMIHVGYVTQMRTVRTQCFTTVGKFFDRFPKFEWTPSTLEAVFSTLVFPSLYKLDNEGFLSPTPILKLFIVWSKHPRYFSLLAKHPPGDPSLTPLTQMMRLLVHENVHQSVVATIMEVLERLLTLSDFNPLEPEEEGDESPPAKPMPTVNVVPVDETAIAKLELTVKINYGSALLLDHIPPILERLKRKLVTKNKALSPRELVILARISELVWESETSDTLLKLLLPLLIKKSSADEDVVVPLITTLANLVKNLDEPGKYVRNLAPLFGQVCGAGPRRMLSTMMEAIAKRCDPIAANVLAQNLVVIAELNAWDRKFLNQPDYTRRLDAYKAVNAMVDAKNVDFDLGLIVIHTCFHYLKVETDLSLRDSASYCLRRLAPALCHQYMNDKLLKEILVNNTVLNLVRQGIHSKVDTVYSEAIGLLGAMARECPDANVVFKDLSILTNKTDMEVDFFENLQHLQGHRKARALSKFCLIARKLPQAPNNRTLIQFLLPIAARFLMSERYQKRHVTIDAAIDAVGTVCRLVQWNQYNLILRYYLEKLKTLLPFQKQLTRVIIAILDAFHFDLTRSKEVAEVMKAIELSEPQIAVTVVPEVAEFDEGLADGEALEKSGVAGDEGLMTLLETMETEDGETDKSLKQVDLPAAERVAVLTPAAAVKARDAITRELLPQLHTCIAQRSHTDLKHKVNRRKGGDDRDEEDILRVPIALAAVKLLQQLPKEILDRNLPGIFMKLCSFLKSRLESVRRITRQTLMKIMLSLGPDYLSYLITEMCALLTRGFQVHVLVYTIHSVVVALKDMFRPGDADSCLKDVLECCRMDLFGPTSEEKKVAGIISKVQEAKSTKGYDLYQVMAKYISEKCLTDLLIPIQQVLLRSTSAKSIQICTECLRHVVLGLSQNKFITAESLLIFSYGTISESIPELTGPKTEVLTKEKRERLARKRPDTFLIPKAPRSRYGAITVQARTTASTNAHILMEFGLKLLHAMIKREATRSGDFHQFIDPVVPIVVSCLDAKHVKLTTLALYCLRWMLKMELPAIKDDIEKVVSLLFALLHKFAAAGLSKGDNFDLVASVFKNIVVLIRDVRWHTINEDQLKALLLYAEQDIHDLSRQATAFTLLRAILGRKLIVPEIHDVMLKVAHMTITSESGYVRLQGRQVFHQFLMDYPLGDKLDKHLNFFIQQLSYEMQLGRESALEMLHSLITTFPDVMLSKQCGLLFVAIGARLVNDDVPRCRKMVARCLQTMITRLAHDDRQKLFDIVMLWLTDKKVHHRKLAAQLCGIFVLVEKVDFEKRLVTLLPHIISQFGRGYDDTRPGKFVRSSDAPAIAADNDDPDFAQSLERMSDHHMFQVLQLVLKISEHCPRFFTARPWQEYVSIIAENAQVLLAHPHEWVRLAAAQFLGHVFATLDHAAVAAAAHDKGGSRGFLSRATAPKVKALVLDLCAQLHAEVAPALAAQVVKNLVFLGRVVKAIKPRPAADEDSSDKHPDETRKIPAKGQDILDEVQEIPENADSDNEEEEKDTKDVSLLWMIRRMRRLVNIEVVQSPHSTIMRMSVFQWIGAMVMDSSKAELSPVLYHLLAPIAREITSEDDNKPEMHTLAVEVSKMMKSKLGMEEYTRQLAALAQRIAVRRADRKRVRTKEAITDPEAYAKRKIEKQLKKKDAKKRKIDILKGRKITPKKKVRK